MVQLSHPYMTIGQELADVPADLVFPVLELWGGQVRPAQLPLLALLHSSVLRMGLSWCQQEAGVCLQTAHPPCLFLGF